MLSLIARADDLEKEVRKEELHPAKKRKSVVQNWMKRAEELYTRVEGVKQEVEQGVSWFNHKRLRDNIISITKAIEDHLKEGQFSNGVILLDVASSSLPLVTTEIRGQQFGENLRKIVSWLRERDKVYKIGVYGMGGAGKTTLATHIHDELLGQSVSVYWVTVSQHCTVSNLQHKIAKVLGVSEALEDADEMRRPATLSVSLKNRGNVVLILDDVWEHLRLEKVGLPLGAKCKLLLTTRSFDVCRMMACQESVKVQVLSEEESLSFFTEMLGNYDDLSNELKDIAKMVAKECAGLPLGIKVVATSMRGVSNVFEWNNTLEELKNPARIHKGLEDEVFRSLQVSYSRLNDVKLRNCFLSCALYPEDCEFERNELVNLWIMEGHLEEIPSRREKLDMAHSMLNRLIGACLLDTKKNWARRDVVKMHDLIRDMAIHISRQSHHTMIKVGMWLHDVPRLQEWTEELTKVSLVRNNIREIHLGMPPRCPNLSSLLLQDNPLETIPESFFQFLSGLKFLDLSETRITRVPSSVSYLTNLSTLRLNGCDFLTHVPSLEKLSNLRHLDLTSCHSLSVLPQGMDKLVNLESLLLQGCDELRVTFRELTVGLSNIQCLELPDSVKDAQATDILNLRYLERVIDCRMRNASNFDIYVQSENFHQLTSYRFHVTSGDATSLEKCGSDRSVTIGGTTLEGGAYQAQLPQNIQELRVLDCLFNVISLHDAFALSNGCKSLTKLMIWSCRGIKYVWAPSKPTPFGNLEELIINTSSFIGLAKGRIPPRAYRNLKSLKVYNCPKVEKLFTPCMLNGQLGNLEEITINDCESLVAIFAGSELDEDANIEFTKLRVLHLGMFNSQLGNLEERLVEIFAGSELDEDANIQLPKLRSLDLNKLPRLVSICKTGLQLCCKSIETITVMDCKELRKLPLFDQVLGNDQSPSAPPRCLKSIEVKEQWWESLVWDDPRMKQTLQPFLKFY